MSEIYGQNGLEYNYVPDWPTLPEGMRFIECPGVAVDSLDNIYVLTRGDHPLIVFDKEGNFIKTLGRGLFSNRTHGLYIAHDDSILVADDGLHTIQKFGPGGDDKVMEIGERSHPAPIWSGQPFNRPTSAAIMASNGDVYISDGYGNSRVHVYSGDGNYRFSWGEPGIEAGQFIRPHNIAIDDKDNVYVVDREAHRIQIFDPNGNFMNMWNNIHRPDAMVLWKDHIYIGELNGMTGMEGAPGLGHRVSIYDLAGNLVSRFGDEEEGSGPGQFHAPHGIAVDSEGSIYVSEVSYTITGSRMDPPRELRSISKYKLA